jgi:mRNA interferase RelE/StbE
VESYKIQIKPSASKELDLVGSKKDRQRIVTRIYSLADNPRPTGCEKLAAEEDKYRVRQGNYRVVYSINDQRRMVVVTKIDHRRDVYR